MPPSAELQKSAPVSPAPVPPPSAPRRSRGLFLWVSIAVHGLLVLAAIFYVVSTYAPKPEKVVCSPGSPVSPAITTADTKRKLVQQQSLNVAPPTVNRITVAGGPVRLPELPALGSPEESSWAPPAMPANAAAPSLIPPGNLPTVFLGDVPITGNRVAFLLDMSGTMSGERQTALADQFDRAFEKLPPTTEVMVILWAGNAWMAGQTMKETAGDWKRFDARHWEPGPNLRAPEWTRLTPANRKRILADFRAARIEPGNTDLRAPWLWLLQAKPAPDSVFFLTDGQRDPAVAPEVYHADLAKLIGRLPSATQINVLAVKAEKSWAEDLQLLAKKARAKFQLIP